MSTEVPVIDWHKLAKDAGGFSPQVFEFVRDGLQHASEMSSRGRQEEMVADESRHVSGQELCLGLRDLAIRRYGPLARTVLGHWNVHSTDDFGKVVFALINVGILRKTDEDSMDDFISVYEFDEAFAEGELI
ncbi:MAG: hypothetical protein ED559_03665 [Phycisphaera sp.]|nr:MAG: hypothetical protein ED559_03665 [Phycisphaera sp.]